MSTAREAAERIDRDASIDDGCYEGGMFDADAATAIVQEAIDAETASLASVLRDIVGSYVAGYLARQGGPYRKGGTRAFINGDNLRRAAIALGMMEADDDK